MRKMISKPNIYGRVDPREIGTYHFQEAARYLRISVATLKTWTRGRRYGIGRNRFFEPVIKIPESQRLLSFMDLVELHVLKALRKTDNISLPKIRAAVDYLGDKLKSPHPLADARLKTDSLDLFVEHFGQLVNVSRHGQLAMREILGLYLRRVEHDAWGIANRLYPILKTTEPEAKVIVIDPLISFGQPTIAGSGVRTGILAERKKAGDSIERLAEDYGLQAFQVQEALNYERGRAA